MNNSGRTGISIADLSATLFLLVMMFNRVSLKYPSSWEVQRQVISHTNFPANHVLLLQAEKGKLY